MKSTVTDFDSLPHMELTIGPGSNPPSVFLFRVVRCLRRTVEFQQEHFFVTFMFSAPATLYPLAPARFGHDTGAYASPFGRSGCLRVTAQ